MARTYRKPAPPGPNQTALREMAPEGRAGYKAQLFAQIHSGTITFDLDGVRYTVSRFRQQGSVFECVVAASDANGSLPLGPTEDLPDANPFRFVNPPILVPDGTWTKGATEEEDQMNFSENPAEALKTFLSSAVNRAARARGWV